MRKLPVYIIVDSSFSMRGKPIQQINTGFGELINKLKRDPVLIETLYLGIIEFNTNAQQVLPLTPIWQVITPKMEAKGRSNMGAAFKLLNNCLKHEVEKSNMEKEIRGDYKTIIYLLTDGAPSDAWKNHLKELKKNHKPRIISFGTKQANLEVLKKISNEYDIIDLNPFESGLTSFFEMVSQSIPTYAASVNIESNPDGNINELPIISYSIHEELLF